MRGACGPTGTSGSGRTAAARRCVSRRPALPVRHRHGWLGRAARRRLRSRPAACRGTDSIGAASIAEAPPLRRGSAKRGCAAKTAGLSTDCSRYVESPHGAEPLWSQNAGVVERRVSRAGGRCPATHPSGSPARSLRRTSSSRPQRVIKDLLRGTFIRTREGAADVKRADGREPLIHGGCEPASEGKRSYPHSPQVPVNRSAAW